MTRFGGGAKASTTRLVSFWVGIGFLSGRHRMAPGRHRVATGTEIRDTPGNPGRAKSKLYQGLGYTRKVQEITRKREFNPHNLKVVGLNPTPATTDNLAGFPPEPA